MTLPWYGVKRSIESDPTDLRSWLCIESPHFAGARLSEIGYAPREIGHIRQMIEVFSHAGFEEIRDVCRLFQWLLPGLITNIAYLRAQLQDASNTSVSG